MATKTAAHHVTATQKTTSVVLTPPTEWRAVSTKGGITRTAVQPYGTPTEGTLINIAQTFDDGVDGGQWSGTVQLWSGATMIETTAPVLFMIAPTVMTYFGSGAYQVSVV